MSNPSIEWIPQVFTAVVIAVIITFPILILFLLIRAIRNSSTTQQKESQRLLGEVVELLKENNRLLSIKKADPPSDKDKP